MVESFRNFCMHQFNHLLFYEEHQFFDGILQCFFKSMKNNSKFEKVFTFELYYIYIDTFLLIMNRLMSCKIQTKNNPYFGDFKANMPEHILRDKNSQGIEKQFETKIKCRLYNKIADSAERLKAMLKDSLILIKALGKIVLYASSNKWSPSCSGELNYLFSFLVEVANIIQALGGRPKEDILSFRNIIAQILESSFDLLTTYLRMQPKNGREDELSLKLQEQSNKKLKDTKIEVSLKLVKLIKKISEASDDLDKKHDIKLICKSNIASFYKLVTECIRQDESVKKLFLKRTYLKDLLRLDMRISTDSKSYSDLISSLKTLMMELIVDNSLIDLTIEQEIRYFFYSDFKKYTEA